MVHIMNCDDGRIDVIFAAVGAVTPVAVVIRVRVWVQIQNEVKWII